ncbi:hypothetical protein ACFO0N_00550 [Halobium salinum]|uniref:Sporulation and cell division protein SsgA n=1 Tax=Halobium salinum TaxID=1364940 RepID=A0ABD5P6S5_9EURY|nr:hypothetical protein [Halobium salinum]
MKFPFVSAVGSDGRRYDLPDDLDGTPSLVHVSFGSDPEDASTWRSLVDSLAGDSPELGWHEVQVHQRGRDGGRPVTDGGPAVRAADADDSSALTLHTDERGLRAALSLDGDETHGYTMLLDGDDVRWTTTGPATEDTEAELRDILGC